MNTVVTRFAPSPTGFLHVGGARTALFNWLYARHNGGAFILRIENTDLIRSNKKSVNAIFEALNWLEIDWDETPFFQTNRVDIYRYYLNQLLEAEKAYYCNCSRDDLADMRKEAIAVGGKPKYNGKCRNKRRKASNNSVVRFRAPLRGATILNDIIKGKIIFQNKEQDDFVIFRSNGLPTYNFAVVVDDMDMNISTVIRGDDHVMNTPKQIMLYNAFKKTIPIFGHVPMVLGKDKTRLSKRHNAISVTAYRDMGFLPDAFINYIVRLGWSHGNQEFFTRNDLIKKFNLKNIGKSASVFDFEKLKSLNAEHIRASSSTKLAQNSLQFMKKKGYDVENRRYLTRVIATLRERSKTLCEMVDSAHFYYKDISPPYDEKASKKFLKADISEALSLLVLRFQAIENFDLKSQEKSFKWVMQKTGLSFGKIAQAVRVALTGGAISPGIFEMIEVLGKDIAIKRLETAIAFILDKYKKG